PLSQRLITVVTKYSQCLTGSSHIGDELLFPSTLETTGVFGEGCKSPGAAGPDLAPALGAASPRAVPSFPGLGGSSDGGPKLPLGAGASAGPCTEAPPGLLLLTDQKVPLFLFKKKHTHTEGRCGSRKRQGPKRKERQAEAAAPARNPPGSLVVAQNNSVPTLRPVVGKEPPSVSAARTRNLALETRGPKRPRLPQEPESVVLWLSSPLPLPPDSGWGVDTQFASLPVFLFTQDRSRSLRQCYKVIDSRDWNGWNPLLLGSRPDPPVERGGGGDRKCPHGMGQV
ncbi:hypothetical protein E2320_006749, partial [Naja naja]